MNKSKVKDIFSAYYKFWLIFFNIGLISLVLFITLLRWILGLDIFLNAIPTTIIIASILALLIGGMFHVSDEYLIPKRSKN